MTEAIYKGLASNVWPFTQYTYKMRTWKQTADIFHFSLQRKAFSRELLGRE